MYMCRQVRVSTSGSIHGVNKTSTAGIQEINKSPGFSSLARTFVSYAPHFLLSSFPSRYQLYIARVPCESNMMLETSETNTGLPISNFV